jgi:integrase
MPSDVAACLRLMMLTGCRPSEAAGIEWEEIDFHAKLWNKPADAPGRSKSRRADVVPLVDEAMEILSARRGNGSPYVFPSGRARRVANGGGPGVLTENRLAASLRDVAPRLARLGVASFTPHDLRRTVTTGLFDIDVSEYIVKRTLNHATRGVTDTHYNKSAFIRQRRAALEAWTDYLAQTIRGAQAQADNVVPFAKVGGR